MKTTNTASPEMIARRQTFDGVTIYLASDSTLWTRTHQISRTPLAVADRFRIIDDMSIMTYAELPQLIRDAKAGKLPCQRPAFDSAAAEMRVQFGSAERMRKAREHIEHNRNPWSRK